MVKMILAVSQNGVIGNDGKLPWKIPEDLKRFKKLTEGNVVIMGRKTYESIGKPLPNRINIVLSGSWKMSKDYPDDILIASNLQEALEISSSFPGKEIFIIGGESVYRESLERVS